MTTTAKIRAQVATLQCTLTDRGEKWDADSVGVHVTTTLQFDPEATAESILADWDQATEEAAMERTRTALARLPHA